MMTSLNRSFPCLHEVLGRIMCEGIFQHAIDILSLKGNMQMVFPYSLRGLYLVGHN